jgi:ribosome-interacting GTPase 1
MPANLTPDYLAAEQKLREARTPQEKLDALEEMLRTIPKHKGTDHLQADIKRRIKQTKQDATKSAAKTSSHAYYVKPEGIGQVFLVGPPNSGKSSLLDALTNAKPQIASFPFTTQIYQPGMMRYEDVSIQLVDMPPLSPQAPVPWYCSVVRYGNAALLVVSLASDDILTEVEDLARMLADGKVVLAARNEPAGQFDTGVAALRTLMVATHAHAPDAAARLELLQEVTGQRWPVVTLDLEDPASAEPLRKAIYDMLGLIRTYSKLPGKPPDRADPFVLKAGTTVEVLAGRIHKEMKEGLQYARIWSKDGKIDGLRVPRDYLLQEGDVAEIHI